MRLHINADAAGPPAPLVRAAEYVRKSTDHQEYSTKLQSAANRAYAARHGMTIVRTYADEGKSGLTLGGREDLRRLLNDVQSGAADFEVILVYDVSRWGRFQDIDESGYYEHICKRAGIRIHYCVEQFVNDGSPLSVVIKNIKRAMASEYSRELSEKVFAAHARLAACGFSQGGAPSYGLRRLLVGQDGAVKLQLRHGERKSLQNDRVVWVPGSQGEVEAVRWIFENFARRKKEPELARLLNERGVPALRGHAWTSKSVRRVLRNERYIGNYVWNRFSLKLHMRPRRNTPDEWIRAEGVIAPLVPRHLFEAARQILAERKLKPTTEQRLELLRCLLQKHGRLTSKVISRAPGVPSASSYHRWFGSLIAAYQLIGYTRYRPHKPRKSPARRLAWVTARLSDEQLLALLRDILKKRGFLNHKIINETEGIPSASYFAARFGSSRRAYRLAGFLGASLLASRPSSRRARHAATMIMSKADMLTILRRLLERHGKLTEKIIIASRQAPGIAAYVDRFGSIGNAYRLIGYGVGFEPRCWKSRKMSDAQLLHGLRELLRKQGRLSHGIIDGSREVPHSETYRRRFGSLRRAYALIGYAAS